MKIRILCFVGMVLISLYLPFWFFCIFAFLYALVWTPYEILILAVLIDGQFGNAAYGISYRYTLAMSFFLILGFYIKPLLRFYK